MNSETKIEPTLLERFFEEFPKGGKLLIVTHDNPDPDALSSALALEKIAGVLGRATSTIAYGGIIGRAENAHMVKVLRMELVAMDEVRMGDYAKIALVDTQPRTGNNSLPARKRPDLVVDHHPLIRTTSTVPFAEVREGYGSTATILSEYLFAFDLEVGKILATALLYGIKAETQDLRREVHPVDVECYLKLLPLADTKLLGKIVTSRVPPAYFENLLQAIQNAQVIGNTVVTRLAQVANPDMIPEFADLMLRLQGTAWSFCIGSFQGSIYLSIRSTHRRKNSGLLMKRLLQGRGSGGGHGLMAGGRIDVPGKEPWEVHEIAEKVEADFLRLLGKDQATRTSLTGNNGKTAKEGRGILFPRRHPFLRDVWKRMG